MVAVDGHAVAHGKSEADVVSVVAFGITEGRHIFALLPLKIDEDLFYGAVGNDAPMETYVEGKVLYLIA